MKCLFLIREPGECFVGAHFVHHFTYIQSMYFSECMLSFKEILDEEITRINQALDNLLTVKRNSANYLGTIHVRYYEDLKEYILRDTRAKRLRPLFLIAAYKAINRKKELKHLYRVACSLEFLHNASLIHDDLIDHDETRRGGPTFHIKYRDWYRDTFPNNKKKSPDFGTTLAILGGDSLFNLGSEAINCSELKSKIGMKCLDHYQEGYSNLVEGALLETAMIWDNNTSVKKYLEMAYLKTANLFEKALIIGAIIAGGNDTHIQALSTFGVKIGQAYQIQDDILGTFGDESITGKSATGDIKEGKKTMILIQALLKCTMEKKLILEALVGKNDISGDDIEQVRNIFRESGALEATKKIRDERLRQGQDAIKNVSAQFDSKYFEFLMVLSQTLVNRTF